MCLELDLVLGNLCPLQRKIDMNIKHIKYIGSGVRGYWLAFDGWKSSLYDLEMKNFQVCLWI